MDRKQLIRKLRYYFQYIPFTLNTLLYAAAFYIAWRLLYRPAPKKLEEDTDSFRQIVLLLAKMAFWFLLVFVGVSVLSTIISWIYYKWLQQKQNKRLQVQFTNETKKGKQNRLYMEASLEGAFRPVLGFVNGRLFYDDLLLTDKFALLSNKRKENSLKRLAIAGKSRLQLPDIKEYQLKGGFVYFEDMLHIFSLAIRQPVSGQFYQPPTLQEEHEQDVFPKKTETTDVRIDQLRRVQGDYFNYKDFETGDDVRRIVWKVYARNRDLVVRVPEIFEPYASHVYFYASFEASVKQQWLNDDYLREMLNYYKNNVWTIYDALSKKEWDIRYIPDQQFTLPEELPARERASRVISNSTWQKGQNLGQYFNARYGTVLCVSSLTDLKELQQVLDKCDGSTVIYFVKLSRTFRHFVAWSLLKRILFLSPKDRLSRLRTKWTFAPMRLQLQKREKEIEAMLAKAAATSGVI